MEEIPKPSFVDDPKFLKSLDALDRGLTTAAAEEPPEEKEDDAPARAVPPPLRPSLPPPATRATPSPSTTGQAVEPANAAGAAARPSLLELFPPAPASGSPPSLPASQSSRPRSTPPATMTPMEARALEIPATADRTTLAGHLGPAPPAGTLTYETFYGFSEKPFSLSPDPKFLYSSGSHDFVAQQLLGAIRGHEGVAVLTGALGTGKTTICRAIVEQLDRRTLTSFLPDPLVTADDLLKAVLVDFGVISRDDLARGRLANATRHDLSSSLREFFESIASLPASAVLIVDEAQGLSADILEQIGLLADVDGATRVLQLVLVGEPQLADMLRRPELQQLQDRISVRCELNPLAEDEVAGYVTHRLLVAGTNPRVTFDDQALARVYDYSAGVPRMINLLCDRALSLGHDSAAGVIGRRLIDAAADELEIGAPGSGAASFLQTAAVGGGLVLLMLVGAATAGVVFHDRLQSFIVRWESIPPLPPEPQLRVAPPLPPVAAPAEPDKPRPPAI